VKQHLPTIKKSRRTLSQIQVQLFTRDQFKTQAIKRNFVKLPPPPVLDRSFDTVVEDVEVSNQEQELQELYD
jgi:hypothetical protein